MKNDIKPKILWPEKIKTGKGFKALFINPPSVPFNLLMGALSNKDEYLYQTVSMPMGILYLSSVLKKYRPGIEIHLIDLAKEYHDFVADEFRQEMSLNEFIDKVLTEKIPPDLGMPNRASSTI